MIESHSMGKQLEISHMLKGQLLKFNIENEDLRSARKYQSDFKVHKYCKVASSSIQF